jgi:hypothetical protein
MRTSGVWPGISSPTSTRTEPLFRQTKRFHEILDLVYPGQSADADGRPRRGAGDLDGGLMG